MESAHLEKFSRLTNKEIDATFNIIKQFTKKQDTKAELIKSIKTIVKTIMLLKKHLGMSVNDVRKDMSNITARKLRSIHQSMRRATTNARTRRDKRQRIVKVMMLVDDFLQSGEQKLAIITE